MKHNPILERKKKQSLKYLHKVWNQSPLKPDKETKKIPQMQVKNNYFEMRSAIKDGIFLFLCYISTKWSKENGSNKRDLLCDPRNCEVISKKGIFVAVVDFR